MSATANETQVGGSHYKGVAYQHWDLCWDFHLGHLPSAITKYVTRHTKKDGRQGIEKAIHYTQKYIEVIGGTETPYPRVFDMQMSDVLTQDYTPAVSAYTQREILRYVEANGLGQHEAQIVSLLLNPHDRHGLYQVETLLQGILQRDYQMPTYTPDSDDTEDRGQPGRGYVYQEGAGVATDGSATRRAEDGYVGA